MPGIVAKPDNLDDVNSPFDQQPLNELPEAQKRLVDVAAPGLREMLGY